MFLTKKEQIEVVEKLVEYYSAEPDQRKKFKLAPTTSNVSKSIRYAAKELKLPIVATYNWLRELQILSGVRLFTQTGRTYDENAAKKLIEKIEELNSDEEEEEEEEEELESIEERLNPLSRALSEWNSNGCSNISSSDFLKLVEKYGMFSKEYCEENRISPNPNTQGKKVHLGKIVRKLSEIEIFPGVKFGFITHNPKQGTVYGNLLKGEGLKVKPQSSEQEPETTDIVETEQLPEFFKSIKQLHRAGEELEKALHLMRGQMTNVHAHVDAAERRLKEQMDKIELKNVDEFVKLLLPIVIEKVRSEFSSQINSLNASIKSIRRQMDPLLHKDPVSALSPKINGKDKTN